MQSRGIRQHQGHGITAYYHRSSRYNPTHPCLLFLTIFLSAGECVKRVALFNQPALQTLVLGLLLQDPVVGHDQGFALLNDLLLQLLLPPPCRLLPNVGRSPPLLSEESESYRLSSKAVNLYGIRRSGWLGKKGDMKRTDVSRGRENKNNSNIQTVKIH